MIMSFDGHTPYTQDACFIAPSAAVIGDVTLGKDVSVWFGAVLRGDMASIKIGDGSNIQENCTLHCDLNKELVVGKNVTIGHNAVVHSAIIGDNVIVGMQATVLNGAKIGNNVIIGAGALVTENAVIPDNTLVVGIPAKVKAELDPSRTVMNTMNATYYVMEGKKYAAAIAENGGTK